ncbi:MAG TPA: SigE family RNA polymerase sigma factor [Mycobacteriales bacterium]|jgi:RNA polymerase sigma-70 factor (sigma-E family)|nr:SigE family RNA polymerase sigma factor [Mycobacteriales bacterium]
MTLVQLDPVRQVALPAGAGPGAGARRTWGEGAGVEQVGAATSTAADAAAGTTALYAEHAPRMLRVAAVLLSDPAMAEDVVQEAYTALYTSWPRLRDRDAAVGYLHRSVVNGARSRLRRRVVALKHAPAPLPDAASAEDTALAGMAGGPLVAALRALPRREREVVLLRHYLDLSERATADALGLRPGSVKAYGSRGLATLRAALAEPDRQEQPR